ncbi:hypothetical protein AB0H86_07260 [Streptomyces sp. NPDC050997]|uniref:hypothetical protein n=1 Tax=Streptomyces sp. NPDC050997 TaxID=3155519 RepID=UPI00342D8795
MHSARAHPWQDRRLTPDERAHLVVAEMTEDEKFSWLSAPIALPVPGRPEIPDGALGSAGVLPGYPASGPSGDPAG